MNKIIQIAESLDVSLDVLFDRDNVVKTEQNIVAKLGILNPSRNEENEYRLYSQADIDRILMIDFYRGADMNLVDIKKIGTNGSMERRNSLYIPSLLRILFAV